MQRKAGEPVSLEPNKDPDPNPQPIHYKGLRYNRKKKRHLDRVLGKDSINMLFDKVHAWSLFALGHLEDHFRKRSHTPEEVRNFLVQQTMEKVRQDKMIQYFMEELEIPQEGMMFFECNMRDLFSEMVGLKRYEELKYDEGSPVRLLWNGEVYQIEHKDVIKTLDCETVLIIGRWALGYNHFDEVSPWNNGTFAIYKYDPATNNLTDHPTAIIDHYLMFNCHFDDGVLFADDIARFVEYQFHDIEENSDGYSNF